MGDELTPPVSPPPPNPSKEIVARTEGYTSATKVLALSLLQGPFSIAPCNPYYVWFASNKSLYPSL